MLEYRVVKLDGTEVVEEDRIKSRLGATGVFLKVVRGPEYNGEARIMVQCTPHWYEFSDVTECNASSWGLLVITLCGVCKSYLHATRDHGKELRIGA
jgi:hypothetical protein